MAHLRIGISGWRYEPWRKVFYPAGMAQARELDFASRALPTIEINGSFYSLQRLESYRAWYDAPPEDFIFSHKGNRFITHMRRLRDPAPSLSNVFASGVLALREKLGPFLWQLPPNFQFDAEVLEAFLGALPHDTEAALEMARRHEPRMAGRAYLEIDEKRRLRHALEIRHESFGDPAFVKLLRKYKVALVVADTAGKWPGYEDVTADFMYIRLHGEKELYAGGYTDGALDHWARRIKTWSTGGQPDDARLIASAAPPRRAGRDVFCYFDNDIKVHAPFDARRLMSRLGADAGLAPLIDPRRGPPSDPG
ncbi:DUF72 domain-containing protein [Massilia dura]|uniref:DUF72 domain-containing protein n=1 Tax=Pseudoduganella dura TaxID=321982 RepID=A0A6I3X4I0_9BURK|nr:DUF72 domain-containing protein [Pseudoduganella dura]MUI11097.1 DUF72 domain-containing protein [Pseudoduganella dura]GGY03420.1 hypothetical protein GCM10007386_37930 [Pseudoduganella dura]